MRELLHLSVGRRLALLVVLGALTSTGLLVLAGAALRSIGQELRYMQRFVLAPVDSLSTAMEDAAQLQAAVKQLGAEGESARVRVDDEIDRIGKFLSRYKIAWEVAQNPSDDAKRFRGQLKRAGRLELMADEARAVSITDRLLGRIVGNVRSPERDREVLASAIQDCRALRDALRKLLDINIAFIEVSHQAISHHGRIIAALMLALGTAGMLISVAFGIHVHNLIAPRISRLVRKVRRFQELGVNERVIERGGDEITILANALDAGFEAIRARDQEREQFLAVAAHELKTPLTAMVGFSQAALENAPPAPLRDRALEVIKRQSGRVMRLIDDLLLAASARTGKLPFHPKPLELITIIRRALAEVQTTAAERTFDVQLPDQAHMLADESVLTHGLWSLLSFAAVISPPTSPIVVRLEEERARRRLDVTISDPLVPFAEVDRAFSPFSLVQYEGTPTRSAISLFLTREVARLHGGALRIHEAGGQELVLSLELPT